MLFASRLNRISPDAYIEICKDMSFLFQYLYTKPYLLEPKRSVAVECEHPKSLEKILENQVEYEAFTNQLEPSKKT